ncbi:homoserine dehydrogenase [Halobacillus rhizosphaerae]|uniref:homoserine dehydrogenase n=1 Tax=Halobacillus rhizosphaerae TaxID=3064889 RepID=UPI00398AA7A0
MAVIKAALLGYGTVGQGVVEIIQSRKKYLEQLTGAEIKITAILVKHLDRPRPLPASILVTDQFEEILDQKPDVIFEAINGEQPAYTYLSRALDADIPVVSANKALLATHGAALFAKAEKKSLSVKYEAAVASGTPVIGTLTRLLQVNKVVKLEAILNGTTNFILSSMHNQGDSFEDALKAAQKEGFAEADPANDLEGWDAFYKLMILSQLIYGKQPDWHEVTRQGIIAIDQSDLKQATLQGERIKHLAILEESNGKIIAAVKPVHLDSSHSLYGIDGVDNAVTMTTELAGPLTLRGPGAGKMATASAMIEDFLTLFEDQPEKQLQL